MKRLRGKKRIKGKDSIDSLESLRDEVTRGKTGIDSADSVIERASKLKKNIDEELFRKKGKVYVVRETKEGRFELREFGEDE